MNCQIQKFLLSHTSFFTKNLIWLKLQFLAIFKLKLRLIPVGNLRRFILQISLCVNILHNNNYVHSNNYTIIAKDYEKEKKAAMLSVVGIYKEIHKY